MQLTAERFREIVGAPEEGAAGASRDGREKRRAPRSALEVSATLMPFSERFAGENVEAPVRDLSRGGFGFFHDRRLPLGEQFALLLPDAAGGHPVAILCTVTYWQPLAEGFYAVGAQFCRVLRQGQAGLPLVLADAESGEITDTRAAS